jgi:hypothetical protein
MTTEGQKQKCSEQNCFSEIFPTHAMKCQVGRFKKKEKSFDPARIWTPDRSVRNLAITLSMLKYFPVI